MSTTVTYKGETLTTVENQTRTLLTSGKYLEDDLTLVDISRGAPSLQAKTNIAPTTSSQTITPDSGYDGLSSVQINAMPTGTAGTPSATKGAVSNHAVSVTPSVTNATGYISGGTKTGTAVTVSASELVSGSETKTANGTYDVTNLAQIVVDVPSTVGGVYQDQDGFLVLDDQPGTAVTAEPLSVTQNGTYTAPTGKAYTPVTVNVSGGAASASKKQVSFIDYDGTILHSYTKTEWQSISSLPSNPSHTGLAAQGWNWTKAQIDAQLTAMPDGDICVGQMYIAQSGDTEIDVSMPEGRLDPMLSIQVNGTITVDWGDSTASDTVTGTSLTTRQDVPHTYAAAGDYMIKIHVVSGSFRFYGTTSYSLLRKNATTNENRVYANCVRAVRLGNGIASIDSYIFYNCGLLASITIPDSITSMGSYTFNNCYSLASITIPSGITSIGSSNTFTACYSLASVAIPSGVTSIGSNVFSNCSSLASITIPDGVTSIGSNVFSSCASLSSITMPDSATSIGVNAFSNCSSLSSITIPSGVTSISSGVFSGCYSLASITIPDGVTSIGGSAFSACHSLSSITIPSGVKSISGNAFNSCSSLASITIPDGVTSIGSNVFSNCSSLASIIIPDSVTSIGSSVFSNCYSLASIIIPDSVTSIGGSAFNNCHSLASITIPDGVTSIGKSAFSGCYGMAEYHFLSATPPTLGTTAFSSIVSDCKIYVPAASLSAYQAATNWSTYASYMVGE